MSDLGFTCIAGLADLVPLDLYSVRRAAATLAPRARLTIDRRPVWADEPSMVVDFGGHRLVVHAARGRIPDKEYFDAVAGNLFWPAAGDEMARHQAYLAIAAERPAGNPAGAREQAVAITRLMVAFAQAVPILGLHWVGTGAMVSPERLARTPREIDLGHWPVDIWLGYSVFGTDRPGESLVLGARTLGATGFVGCELELPPEPVSEKIEPIRTVFDAVRALLTEERHAEDGAVIEGRGPQRRDFRLEREGNVARLVAHDRQSASG